MPSRTRQQSTSTTGSSTAASTTPQTDGQDNDLLAALLSGRTQLSGDARQFLDNGIQFARGMRGDIVKTIQEAIGATPDGIFGPMTEAALKRWQRSKGLPETGVVDLATWEKVEARTKKGGLADLKGEEDFQRMWDAHPHNYLPDASQNTSSEALRDELGLAHELAPNTCALRLSTMLNRMGPDTAIDVNKAREAGLDKMRAGGLYLARIADPQTDSTNDRAILSAREMWTYIEHHRGPADLEFPPRGRFRNQDEANKAIEEVKQAVQGRKGFVAFDKIYGYGGSGHIDIFDGEQLSDGSWYASEKIKLWFVV